MTVRFYSSVAPEKTLVGTITSGQTTLVVSNTIGLPSLFPYTLAVDYETVTEELVNVTNAAGTTLTVDRAIDGTSASSHTAGARVRHVTSARDFSDSRNHENSDDGVHGLAPGEEIVGTDKVQTLTNKTVVNLQGTLMNPDVNMTGTNTATFTRTPAGGAGTNIIDVVNGAEQTLAIQNNGHIRIRNTVAMDTTTADRRWSVVMSDGTTERAHMATSGQLTTNPRAGTAATNGGFKVIDPGDDFQRKLIQVRNSADTLDQFVVRGGGGVEITMNDDDQIGLYVKSSPSPNLDRFSVVNSADVPIIRVDSVGQFQAFRRMDVQNDDSPASIVLQVQGHPSQSDDLQIWQTGAPATVARVNQLGEANFTSDITTSGIFVAASGWSVTAQVCAAKAGMATLAIALLRTGSNIVADAGGDLFGDPPLGTVNAAFRPDTGFGTNFLTYAVTNGLGTGSVTIGANTGDVTLHTWSTGGTITTGTTMRLTMIYPLTFA